jgi:hypothetical protein
MLKKLLPVTIDNTYRGHTLGLWLLALVLVVKVLQIVSVMIDGPGIVASADGIPLETFGARGAQTTVAAFIGMGISRLFITVICAIVLLRYRSVVTSVFALLALHDIARELVLQQVRTGAPIGPFVNRALLVFTLAGLALSVLSGSRNVKRVA